MEPSVADLESAVAFMVEKIGQGTVVYVHCKGGNGRSAAVVFCWLLETHPTWTLEETQAWLNTKRRVRKKLWLQPHIRAFYERLEDRRGGSAANNDANASSTAVETAVDG